MPRRSWSYNELGKLFSDALARNVEQSKDLPELWCRAWRLLAASLPRFDNDLDLQFYAMLNISCERVGEQLADSF